MRKASFKKKFFDSLISVKTIIIFALFLMPIYLIFIYSFTSVEELYWYFSRLAGEADIPYISLKLVPDRLSISQYVEILIENQQYLKYFINTCIYSIAIVLGQVIIAPIAAYCFAMFNFRFKNHLFFLYILVMLMPFQAVMIPNFIAIKNMGLYDSAWSMIVPNIFSPFAVFLMRQFFLTVQKESIEAAKIDGASDLRIYLQIALPSVKPGLIVMVILGLAEAWNLVEQPLLFLVDETKYPLSVVLRNQEIIPFRILFAGSVMFIMPIILLFMFFQEDILAGIAKINLGNNGGAE